MSHLKSVAARIAFALLVLMAIFAAGASAQPISKFQILLNLDNNPSTGCSVPTLTGTFPGVERILTTTVNTSLVPPQVTKIEVSVCTGATFGAPTDITPAGVHPVGMGNGTGGASVIETFIPASQAPLSAPPIIRLGVLAFDNGGVLRDEMLTATQGPGNGPPILMQAALSIIDVPTLSEMGLLLLGLLLALAAVALLRRRSAAAVMIAILLLGLAGVAWAAAFDLDGNTLGEWPVDSLLATEPTPDAPAGTDIRALFGVRDAAGLHFRIDAVLLFNQPPVANDDAATVTEDSGANPINVLANDTDPEGDSFTVGSVTQAAHGAVAITGGGTGVSYTPNAGYCNNPPGTSLDTFTYTLAPGGNTATVTVTVNCVSTAVDDAYNAVTNTALNVPAGTGVTSNDTVNGGSIASYGATTGGEQTTIGAATPTSAGGSVSLNADGSFTYNPPTNFTGSDTFKYILQNTGGTSMATVTFTVSKATQTINFTSTAPAGAKVGGPTYTVTATATPSGLPVTFTIDATATSVCSISGSTVSFIGAGTCVIDADQPGDVNYAPAPQAQQSFAVGKGDQTITFTSTAPANAKAGGPTYTVTATGGASGQPVTFTIDATATSVCSISGSTVSFLAVGTCVIDANQAGDANYNAATQAQQSVPVGKGDQTITFTSTAPANAKVGGPTYTVTATGGASGQPVTFTIDATATSVCSISGSTVSFLAVGTCVIDANQAGDANYNAAAQAQQSVPVGKGDQTITFTSTAPTTAKVGGPTYTVTATGGASGQPVIFTIDATATSVCSISGSTVSFIGAGTCVIDANQAGDANYNAAPQAQQSFAVAKGDQTITFTSTFPATAKVGGSTYTVTATGGASGQPVIFTIDATATSVCSISGSTVSFIGAGTCVIDANQAGNANYNAATQVQQSGPVAKGDQTITFTSTFPATAKVGGPTYTVTATGGASGQPVIFTIDATATSVCSISGSTVSFIGVGTCVIDANQAGNANYNAATQVQQSGSVNKGDQTITFTSTFPATAKVGGPTYTVTATGGASGQPVIFTIDATATSVCSISGSTVSFIGVGTCVIDANQAGNANYNAAPQVQQSGAVNKGDQAITFTSTFPATAKVGGPTYTVTATGGASGQPVIFTIDATATSVCSISGSTVSFIGAGTCVIDANQAGNANYNAAPQAQQSGPVSKGDQTITFTSTAPAGATVGGPTYTVTATASSGLTVTFTIDATATSVCSISGSTVSFIGVGTCVIDANQAGNASFNAAPQVQQSFPVAKGNQTISFTSTAPVGAAVGGPTYTVTATATSGLPVTFTIDATATSVCSISGSTVSFIGAGTCVIDANQAGNANYNPAPQVQQSFAVAKGNQTISFTSTPPVGATVGGPTYTVTATATSGLTVIFTIDATATSVCSISGSTVSFIGAGTCVIDANQPGDANWNAAPQVQQSFAVAKANQTISFTSTAPINAKVSGPTYTVSAMATSGLAVTFTIDASATSVCSISGATVSFIGGGTCVIDANQAGNANYNAAPQVQQSFLVAKNDQTITFTSTPPVNASVGGPTYTVTATASSGLTVTFTIDASATSVCSISGSTVSFIGGGTCVIDADQAGNFAYNPAPQVQQSFHVNQPPMLTTNPISYTTPGNTQLHVGAVLPGVAAWTDAQNITAKAQPTDSDGPGTLSIVAASGTTANGGTYSVSAPNGIFTYVPAAGFTGTDSFTYQVTDTQSTTTGTVNITVGPRVWYIRDIVDTDNPAGGDGRSTNAFDSIAAFNAATTNNGDIIFIFRGNTGTTPLSGNLTLKDGQKLWGQGIALDLTSSGFGVLVGAGSKPVISSTGDAVSVPATAGNRQNVEVRGLDITATGNGVKVNATGANNVSVTISDDNLSSTSTAGLNGVNLSAGSTGTFAATLNNNAISTTGATANGNAFDARTSAATTMTIDFSNNAVISKATGILIDGSGGGTTTITGFANNAVDPANTGTGISITSAKFDATPGGSYQTVSGGTTVLGVMGNGMGGSGVVLSNVSGDLAFTNLQSFADGGAAFRLTGTGVVNTGAGTGTRVTVGAGVGIFEAVAGPAVDVTNATIDLQLSSLKSMGSATTGVSLDTVTGTFSAGSGSTITSATGTDFNVNAGNAAVTYNGTISDTTGRLVSVTNTTGGTKSFTGTISDTGSGTGQGIFLNSNTGAAISFTGALTLSTGSADAFTATGGGTVTAAPSTGVNTLTTTTGTALKVQNTTIGASGLSFRSISAGTAASGPTNGIVLSSTGTSGGLTVSGTGSAGSGGTIQKTTAEGILITGPANASFSWMSIQNPGTHGISATTANNLTIANTTITDAAGNNTVDDGIHTSNTTGALTITSCTINGARHQGITIDNNNTNMAALSMTGTTVTNTPGGDGMLMQMRGTSVLTTGTISNNTFSNNSATGLQVNNADTGNISSLMVQTNTVTSNNAGMDFDLSQAASMTVVVQGNTITGSHSQALNLVTSTSATGGSMTATLRNNNIGTAGVNDSGSAIGSGIRVANGGLNVSLTIDGNVIREVPNGRGIDVEAQAYASNLNLKAQIINNQVVRPSGTNQNIGCGANVPCPSASIFVLSDSNGLGGFDHVCTAISGNSAYDPTSWPAGGEAAFYFARRTSASNTLSLEGTQANVTNQILATNTVTNFTTTKVIDENTSGTVTIVPAGNCGGFPP